MRAAVLFALLASGCFAPQVSRKTITSRSVAVISVQPDAAQHTAWITVRTTVTRKHYEVSDEMRKHGPTGQSSVRLLHQTTEQEDNVWVCTRVEGSLTPQCVRTKPELATP